MYVATCLFLEVGKLLVSVELALDVPNFLTSERVSPIHQGVYGVLVR